MQLCGALRASLRGGYIQLKRRGAAPRSSLRRRKLRLAALFTMLTLFTAYVGKP
jgi:hypothetical protein